MSPRRDHPPPESNVENPQYPTSNGSITSPVHGGVPHLYNPSFDEEPETIIGENVNVNGELSFQKLLRINGTFSGKLKSSGNLIIGSTGTLNGNIDGMRFLLVEGKIVGNISCETIELRNEVMLFFHLHLIYSLT